MVKNSRMEPDITMTESIHPDTRLGLVHLAVANLTRATDFYQSNIGLQLQRQEGNRAYLGAGGADLLLLSEQPGARPVRGTTGLYHFAILLPSRLDLARSLQHLADTQTAVQGFADHLVSEAIYLSDPDGNGIEIYRDRPRDEWRYPNGQLAIGTEPLDVEGLLAEVEHDTTPWSGMPGETIIGHVHLHVDQLIAAEKFYTEVLGFDLMMRYGPSATFVSAGGYHHHLGANTWAGVGAPPPPADATGLRWFTICLPNDEALESLLSRLRAVGYPLAQQAEGWFLREPAQNGIVLTVEAYE
jgi:catechol 2,3-dioxygenase